MGQPELYPEPRQDRGTDLSESGPITGKQPASGYVVMLEDLHSLAVGDVLQVLGESNTGSSLKVQAGTNDKGNPRVKCLTKAREGSLWRWTCSPCAEFA